MDNSEENKVEEIQIVEEKKEDENIATDEPSDSKEKKEKKFSKKILIISICAIVLIIVAAVIFFLTRPKPTTNEEDLPKLPKPEITDGVRGELGIDKNINESTIDNYLGRKDAVYRDMRMLEDPGNYESIGGDRYLSGYIDGFEVIPLPYIIPVTGLPQEVGDTYTGTTLFYEENGKYIANYKESMKMIEKIFPKDKIIFLMCGGGGYAGMTKNFLVSMGWDENKIYNVGGYWYYKGKHNIDVKKVVDGETKYDFSNVPYHKIDFDKLTKTSNYKAPKVKVAELKLNTQKIEIEEGTSFKLSVIVLPNEADNKEVIWKSSNESIATVDAEGLVKAVKEGTTIITVESKDTKKSISCEVVVKKKKVSTQIKLDDISQELNELALYDLDKKRNEIDKEFYELVNSDANKSKYYTINPDGTSLPNDLWRQEDAKRQQKEQEIKNKRVEIFNRAVNSKKSFVVLIHTKECDVRDYEVIEGAAKILNQNNYQYFSVGTATSNGDETLENSNLDLTNYNWSSSVIIVKNGKLYASVNPDADSIKSDEETKNWLSKYLYIK